MLTICRHPEACGLRHLAFEGEDILQRAGTPKVWDGGRADAGRWAHGKRLTFFADLDGLLEFHERDRRWVFGRYDLMG